MVPVLASVWLLTIGVPLAAAPDQTSAAAQSPTPPGGAQETSDSDEDPTRPVFISVRPEFYEMGDGVDRRLLVVRYDARVWPTLRVLGRGAPGILLRFEAPLVDVNVRGARATGLGDIYGQFVVVPYVRQGFAIAAGSGFLLPSATDELTGSDKWIVAPMVAPLWRMPRALFLVKLQNVTSVADDPGAPEVNYLLVTPFFVHTVGQRWWVMIDSESNTRWTDGGRTGFKSGVQLGRRVRTGIGIWIKPEVWWGPNRGGEWNLKAGIVWYERRR
jgi:hypothetical protein